jgi:SAM-dependent methyltransferase
MSQRSPREIPIEQTQQFLDRVLPSRRPRILEVGCGNGAVTERLQAKGIAVTAIDHSLEAVGAAQQRGVDAVSADFFEYQGGPFDVVLFSRSLHHLAPLEKALEITHSLLAPGGLLVAEEFAIEAVDLETARWFFELSDLLENASLLTGAPAFVAASSQLERWHAEHAPHQPIHRGQDMIIGVGTRFQMLVQEPAPYLYRYVSERIEDSDRGARIVHWMLDVESLRIAGGSLRAAGLRLVARKPTHDDSDTPALLGDSTGTPGGSRPG